MLVLDRRMMLERLLVQRDVALLVLMLLVLPCPPPFSPSLIPSLLAVGRVWLLQPAAGLQLGEHHL